MIGAESKAMSKLIGDMIDFASTLLGSAMPLNCEPVDLQILCREVVDGFRAAHPQRTKILLRQSLGDAPEGYEPPSSERLLRLVAAFVIAPMASSPQRPPTYDTRACPKRYGKTYMKSLAVGSLPSSAASRRWASRWPSATSSTASSRRWRMPS